MAAPTSGELELIAKFREKVRDLNLNDERQADRWLLRWIRARDHNLKEAEKMLRNSMNWRAANGIDDLGSWEVPPNFFRDFPFTIGGLDHGGSPVGLLPLGAWDVRRLIESKSEARKPYLRYVDRILAHICCEAVRKCPPDITQVVMVMDMTGYEFRQVASLKTLEVVGETVRRFDLNHPEFLKLMVIVNAPTFFTIFFEVCKRIMAEKTIKKFHVFGSDETKWKPFLLQHMSVEVIPPSLGGVNEEAEKALDLVNLRKRNAEAKDAKGAEK